MDEGTSVMLDTDETTGESTLTIGDSEDPDLEVTVDGLEDGSDIDVSLDDQQLAERRSKWTPPPYKARRGTLYKYIKTVKSASDGCVTDE